MSYSKLVEYVKISPNSTNPRNNKIDAIVIHHMAGNLSVETCGNVFASTSRQASSNYGIGTDGRIACYVEEENRAWTTGNRGIDNRAITIEVANCSGDPDWRVSDKALESTIALCADICKRYGFKLNYTGDKSGNLQMHKWYDATACPGPYLSSKFQYIADEVNKRIEGKSENNTIYRVQVGAFSVKANAEAMLAKLKECGFDGFIVTDAKADKPDSKPVEVKKTNEEIAIEVIQGKWGNGADRMNRLTAAGYDCGVIQDLVNEMF